MKSLKIIISFMVLGIALTGCKKDFLNLKPLDEVLAKDYFKTPDELKTYVNQFYTNTMFPIYGNHGSDFGTDNEIRSAIDPRLQGSRVLTITGKIDFVNVRNVNYFFDHYKRVEKGYTLDQYKQYLGEAYFFRALSYFSLMQSYGDIQLVTTELFADSPELYKARDPRNIVADHIIASLDSAAKYLTADKTTGASRVNKWMALLMQSRVALYEGSWEKYHNGGDFAVANANPNKYFDKAVKAAEEVMNSNKYDIYSTGNAATDYKGLFSLRDYASNIEVMFWKKYDNGLTRGAPAFVNDRNFRMETPAGNTITKQLADSYLCTDGKPISVSPLFNGYSTIKTEGQNRDPRFFQTIASPDEIWKITEGAPIKYWKEVYDKLNSGGDYNAPTGYLVLKGYNPNMIFHVQQYEETPSIVYRYAEVLLNYVEAKAELGTLTQDDINKTIKKLRDRVGMPNLDMNNITPDPSWDFPLLSPLINEIRRERRVELSLEGFRFFDIQRWAAADELIFGKRPKGLFAAQIANNTLPVDANGFLDPYKNIAPVGYGFVLRRDYLNSIPQSERVLNPTVLTQNPGWE
ncbi:RagB/SusD family nutrient uptake outer membrane protein [Pedobacter sp. ASV1-7]|uniref:RagB/SusD family nutrient uptake outer membrane protein n=1 Tax=Pedobacter sp. ASV1-7 TaxID=3145237 RepID=UPI0032E85BD5